MGNKSSDKRGERVFFKQHMSHKQNTSYLLGYITADMCVHLYFRTKNNCFLFLMITKFCHYKQFWGENLTLKEMNDVETCQNTFIVPCRRNISEFYEIL